MFLSVFELFKIGIGPSSSHTVGPMVAAARFLNQLRVQACPLARIRVTLHGSLAYTGAGHHTDTAVALGLLGEQPDTVDPDAISTHMANLRQARHIVVEGLPKFAFDPDTDIIFDRVHPQPGHANALVFDALDVAGGSLSRQLYYSIGGGFVVTQEQHANGEVGDDGVQVSCPYPFSTSAQMLTMGEASGLRVAQMKRANEHAAGRLNDLDERLDAIWLAMRECMERGLRARGELPGKLRVRRRASQIHQDLVAAPRGRTPAQHDVMDWLGVYAMAVNEENAAGGRVVTSPTNGAAGVVPAVLRYYVDHCDGDAHGVREFLLTAGAIGGIIKHNASISGAEVGCQGEVGSASAMAAAGLCAVLGGTNAQIENAAEIALEHHLGMTCDPIAGLVQVPCIERNAFGAVKAVTAASMALRGDGAHVVSLDSCIETMRQTGADMSEKYKETSTGGLAVNVPQC